MSKRRTLSAREYFRRIGQSEGDRGRYSRSLGQLAKRGPAYAVDWVRDAYWRGHNDAWDIPF